MFATVVTALLTGLVLPQDPVQQRVAARIGGRSQPLPRHLDYPPDPLVDRFAPFADPSGQPVATPLRGAGVADFDGDGNQDSWFLSAASSSSGELSIQMARTSSLGRFRPWYLQPPVGNPVGGATFHSTDFNRGDRVLLIDPSRDDLVAAYYSYAWNAPPRSGRFYLNPVPWKVGTGAYEIATRDDAGDGHDDITVLRSTGSGQAEVRKLRMHSVGAVTVEKTVTLALPVVPRWLRMLDWDGDGLSDAVMHVPGRGVLLVRDDGQRFVPWLGLSFSVAPDDLFAGDADRDGRDDIGIVFDQGILLLLSKPGGYTPVALFDPGGVVAFGSACVLGDERCQLTSVVAFAKDGRGLVRFPSLGGGAFGTPEVRLPSGSAFAGAGPLASRPIVHDLDGDDDQDVLVPLPDGAHWLTLRDDERSFRPVVQAIDDLGPVGETGYRRFRLTVRVPEGALLHGAVGVELAVFLEDITLAVPRYVYWGRLLGEIDRATATASFTIYSLQSSAKLVQLIQSGNAHPFPGAIATGGNALLTIEVKHTVTTTNTGSQRYQAIQVEHEGGEQGSKSAVGVKWTVHASPPKPRLDDDLLPWN